jgi:hypothetical protein
MDRMLNPVVGENNLTAHCSHSIVGILLIRRSTGCVDEVLTRCGEVAILYLSLSAGVMVGANAAR